MFIGRKKELKRLSEFSERKTSALIVCSGRRRIGKSTLIEYFSKGKKFYEFYGLPPREGMTNKDQLTHFSTLLSTAFGTPLIYFDDWTAALLMLAKFTEHGQAIIFLDEISWMGQYDRDFPGKLKGIWDTKFKNNPELLLILCGSVSSWIQDNILNDKGFMGRISLNLHLNELPLSDANQFWRRNPNMSPFEKFKILAITGGIPRYLEEIQPEKSAEDNIKRLCFSPGAVLFEEFDKIFRDIFGKNAEEYKRIVLALVDGKIQPFELCDTLDTQPTGALSKKMDNLESCGFITRDYVYQNQKKSRKLSKYRLSDNYLRFYLKYIEPRKEQIRQGLFDDLHLEDLPGWNSILGLQFENLVLNNLKEIVARLDIAPSAILSASPYFQTKTLRKDSCQIDLLIDTKHSLYVCECKYRQQIGLEVIEEVKEKIKRLKVGKNVSIRPILIYLGDLSDRVRREGYFSQIISFEDLLSNESH
jgi:AAA+ ATPase superfamily predicted ATPase